MTKPVVLIQGAKSFDQVPGLNRIANDADIRFAADFSQLKQHLPDAEIIFSWDFRDTRLRDVWNSAGKLKWIHWSGAGVNAALFPELVESNITLTNSRGVFDQAMAEYVLGLILIFVKRFHTMLAAQQRIEWRYQMSERLAGKKALIVGAGSIGTAIGRLLKACGMQIRGVRRTVKGEDADFETVAPVTELNQQLPWADFVIIVTPLTDETYHLFGAEQFKAMQNSARLLNVGRGPIVDEDALIKALKNEEIAGAALDVFETEPLPEDSPLWKMTNVVVSPHISGDYLESLAALVDGFVENFYRYYSGETLLNLVNKELGY